MSASWFVPQWPAPGRVRALITQRGGGVSSGPYASFNLGTHVGDNPASVSANRALLRAQLPNEPAWLNQVHGTVVADLDGAALPAQADAAVTRTPRRVCAIMTADCLPLLLCDRAASVLGAAHCGWRGLAAGVIERTLDAMACEGGELIAYLGPAIGPQSYEVGAEVRQAFVQHDAVSAVAFIERGSGKWLADLYQLARLRLQGRGVRQIYGGDACTYAQPQRFFSFRRDGTTGRMAALLWLDTREG